MIDDEIFYFRVSKDLKEKIKIYDKDYWNAFAEKVIIKTLKDIEKANLKKTLKKHTGKIY